ncbi:MAG TPA: phosphoribosylglycinamide formyltransferase [Puia sp.]|nr:phosphoribosylglycinamide formyltransferase [Puia sp.]
MHQVAIFASGAGSNAARIIDRFRHHPSIKISLIVCNKPDAGVLAIAAKEHIPTLLIEKERFFRGDAYVGELQRLNISFIVLAGFLWKVPSALIRAYSGRIINIHPALLPKYGGKGMYGRLVHEAVIAAKEKESGITIHYVDELYDHGQIIFQASSLIEPGDTPGILAQKVHRLEHEHFPRVIEELLLALPSISHPSSADPKSGHAGSGLSKDR